MMGSMNEEIEITKDGEEIIIGFNPRFLTDVLKVIDDEDIFIYMRDANHHVSSGMMQELISMLYYQSISMRGLINHG